MALHDSGEAETFDHANDGCVEYLASEAETHESDVEHDRDCTTCPVRLPEATGPSAATSADVGRAQGGVFDVSHTRPRRRDRDGRARHSLRTTSSSSPRRLGSATRAMAAIFAPGIAKANATRGRPPEAHTRPGAPFTRAGWAARARPLNVSATAFAPRTSAAAPMWTAAPSARATTSGSSTWS